MTMTSRKKKKNHTKAVIAINTDKNIGMEVVKSHIRKCKLRYHIMADCWYMNVNQGRMLQATINDHERVENYFERIVALNGYLEQHLNEYETLLRHGTERFIPEFSSQTKRHGLSKKKGKGKSIVTI
jgi:hypothetical protein